MIPDRAMTVAGEPVTSICEHLGLIRGVVVTGARQDGTPITAHRYWYPNGRMSPGKAGQHDLDFA